jgi:hypothetical protein
MLSAGPQEMMNDPLPTAEPLSDALFLDVTATCLRRVYRAWPLQLPSIVRATSRPNSMSQ